MAKKNLVILMGNIGSGKSSITKEYVEQGYFVVSHDNLRYMLGNGKYIYDDSMESSIAKAIHVMFRRLIVLGKDVIVDEVNFTKDERAKYIRYARRRGYKIKCAHLKLITCKESVDRRMTNPHGLPDKHLWEEVYQKFLHVYEKPTLKEGFHEIEEI